VGISSYATAVAGTEQEPLPVAVLGSGSDYTVFFNRLGISSADLIFDGPYGVYHSVYDTYRWMATQGDPGFRYVTAMARFAGALALRFANADLLPFDGPAYGREIARYARGLSAATLGAATRSELAALAVKAEAWSAAADAADRSLASRLRGSGLEPAELEAANAWLLSLERGVCDDGGLPHRGWFKHLIYAPLPSYLAETLPAIREALEAGDVPLARNEIARLGSRLDAAAQSARQIGTTITSPPPRPTPPRR
jgi:N-acetylated-alpha-linked acidic dipeptidase